MRPDLAVAREARGARRPAVLVVDPNPAVPELVAALGNERWRVWHAPDPAGATAIVDQARPDLVVLEPAPSGTAGLLLCAELAERGLRVLVHSSCSTHSDRQLALRLGAAAFVCKAAGPAELARCLRTLLGEEEPARGDLPISRVGGDATLDHVRRRLMVDDRCVRLSSMEHRLLVALARHPDRPVSRSELAAAAWGRAGVPASRAIDTEISRLREKLARLGPRLGIRTVRGVGYRLVAESRAPEPDTGAGTARHDDANSRGPPSRPQHAS